jgi:orotate phosphoribosyltransferase
LLADYKKAFIDFAIEAGVIQFGEFELKSGRISPYFFNAGEFKSGRAVKKLGEYYAHALVASGISADGLFGPAYKGIPLVVATAIAMAEHNGKDLPYTFNRKEAKDHGEGGTLVGAPLRGDIAIVDDVITAGTAIREVMPFFDGETARARSVLVAIDRQERGKGELSAIQEVERDYSVDVISVVSLEDIVQYMTEQGGFTSEIEDIGSYRTQYGIASES